MKFNCLRCCFLVFSVFIHFSASAQQALSLKQALETALNNYPSIKAKTNYLKSSMAYTKAAKREALPNIIVSGQQDYGTVNGQNGPLYGYGYAVASSGIPQASQNWDAAFGSLYLTNMNWDFFAFGRARERVKAAQSYVIRDSYDRDQEMFEQEVKVASAYLNLLAAQRLVRTATYNLSRADTLRSVVTLRAKNGLIAGVDSSLAIAEVSNAKTVLTNATDAEQEQTSQLAMLMGATQGDFILDTLFITKMPVSFSDTVSVIHPVLKYYSSRIAVSEAQSRFINTLKYPTFSFFGVFQARGSGFSSDYAINPSGYDKGYFNGISPDRINYLVGVGLTWNITSLSRIKQQVIAQHDVSKALQNEYEEVDLQLKSQQILADQKITNSISNFYEAPVQVKAASDAYLQKTVLYKNGLTDIIEVTQTLYTLNRAEINRDIAYSNVWQALLLKAASTGDFDLFMKAVR
jgi:outer membrane protein TolC